MTIKLKTVVGEGRGRITAVNLPAELAAGAWITGSISMVNDGEADKMASVFVTVWDGKAYGAVFDLAKGASVDTEIPANLVAMPNQDAVIDIYACHAELGGEFLIGGVEFKIDHKVTH